MRRSRSGEGSPTTIRWETLMRFIEEEQRMILLKKTQWGNLNRKSRAQDHAISGKMDTLKSRATSGKTYRNDLISKSTITEETQGLKAHSYSSSNSSPTTIIIIIIINIIHLIMRI